MLQAGAPAPSFEARPVFGRLVRHAGGPRRRPLAIYFVRYLGSPTTRASLAEIDARFDAYDLGGVDVLIVSPSPLGIARDQVPRFQVRAPLVADEDGALGQVFSVGRDPALLCTLRGLGEMDWARTVRAWRRGRGQPVGRPLQLAAEFVVGADGKLSYAAYACSIFAGPDHAEMMRCAGLA